MWRYVLIHTLWFAILLLVHFFGGKRDRAVVALSIAGIAAYLAWRGAMDPYAWFFYAAYSAVTFAVSGRFRAWALARLDVLSARLETISRELDKGRGLLAHRNRETGALDRRARQIFELYERVKEMSRCLDPLEAFLVLGEALAENFSFETVKIALFDPSEMRPSKPSEYYEAAYETLRGSVNRPTLLANRQKMRAEVFPFDDMIFKHFLASPPRSGPPRRSAFAGDRPEFPSAFTSFPIFVRERPAAILTIVGAAARDLPLYHILIERFAGEMQRIHLYEQVQSMATHDALTDTYVRRHLLERFEDETARCRRLGLPLSFLMIDVDHFKRVNDQYGHLAGDVVLKETARMIKKSVREADLVGRYGGEEFGVILFEADRTAALAVAERIRRSVEESEFPAYDARHRVTVSIGLACMERGEKDPRNLIEEADDALYRAKNGGRNAVRVWEPSAPPGVL